MVKRRYNLTNQNVNPYPWSIGAESKLVFKTDAGVTLAVKNSTLTPTGATFLLKNAGTDVIYFGQKYFLQILLDNKWFDIEKYTGWTLELINLNPGNEMELVTDWSNFYGALPPGTYRFVKETHLKTYRGGKRIYVNAPFTIE